MDYSGKVCPYCKAGFTPEDDVVVCGSCEMPHHRECWEENQGCTTFGCTGTIVQSAQAGAQPVICAACGRQNSGGYSFCAYCGAKIVPAVAPVQYQYAGAGFSSGGAQQPAQSLQWPAQGAQWPAQGAQQPAQSSQWPAQGAQWPAQGAQQPAQSLQWPAQGAQWQAQGAQPYYPPGGYQGGYAQNIPGEFSAADVAAFTQKNPGFYVGKFGVMRQKNSSASWNWCAFLVGPYWCFYRRMYLAGVLVLLVQIVLSFLGDYARLANLGVIIFLGIMGNSFYFSRFKKTLASTAGFTEVQRQYYLKIHGGVSVGAVIGLIAAYIVVLIVLILTYVYYYGVI